MDIGDLIHFKQPGEDAGRPPKIKMQRLFNRKVRVTRWEVRTSRFDDGNRLGVYAEIEGQDLETGEPWRITTASNVIIDQLHTIAKAQSEQNIEDRSFTCVFTRFRDFVKMLPARED